MAKNSDGTLDVLVLGEHPCAALCAALLVHKSKLRVLHATIPGEAPPDRLVVINPDFFELHPLTEGLRRKIELSAIYGLRFVSDHPEVSSETRGKSALAFVSTYKSVRGEMMKLAEGQQVQTIPARRLEIHRLDERGIDVTLNNKPLRPKVLVVAGVLEEAQQKVLGMPEGWGPDVVHRYTFLRLPSKWAQVGARPMIVMSLNLKDRLLWAWLLPGEKGVQLAVEQPAETLGQIKPLELLGHWAGVLQSHGILSGKGDLPLHSAQSLDLPLAGALAHEGLANRTLLIGPAGGFYSACSEDIYPNCWSALFAADAIKKALRETHLQDALQPYRHKWRTTLGDYLRGPQQNLRFLLPLVYRNQVMTTRLTEAILLGKSVVR